MYLFSIYLVDFRKKFRTKNPPIRLNFYTIFLISDFQVLHKCLTGLFGHSLLKYWFILQKKPRNLLWNWLVEFFLKNRYSKYLAWPLWSSWKVMEDKLYERDNFFTCLTNLFRHFHVFFSVSTIASRADLKFREFGQIFASTAPHPTLDLAPKIEITNALDA